MDNISQTILADVLAAMQPAEELGGPEGADYLTLMTAIEEAARSRRETYQGRIEASP